MIVDGFSSDQVVLACTNAPIRIRCMWICCWSCQNPSPTRLVMSWCAPMAQHPHIEFHALLHWFLQRQSARESPRLDAKEEPSKFLALEDLVTCIWHFLYPSISFSEKGIGSEYKLRAWSFQSGRGVSSAICAQNLWQLQKVRSWCQCLSSSCPVLFSHARAAQQETWTLTVVVCSVLP